MGPRPLEIDGLGSLSIAHALSPVRAGERVCEMERPGERCGSPGNSVVDVLCVTGVSGVSGAVRATLSSLCVLSRRLERE